MIKQIELKLKNAKLVGDKSIIHEIRKEQKELENKYAINKKLFKSFRDSDKKSEGSIKSIISKDSSKMTSTTQTVNNELKELRKNRKAEYLRTMKAFEEKLSRLEKSLVEKFTTENTIESFLTPTKKEIVKREIQKIR